MTDIYQYLIVEKNGPIDIVTLNRPQALNSLNKQLFSELHHYFSVLQDDYQTRVVILRGEGRSFCAGADLDSSAFATGEGREAQQYEVQRKASSLIRLMRSCSQPIIALCHGPICGGGFSIVLAADVRIAAENTKMNAAYLRVGLSGTDMGSGYFLPRIVGFSNAAELLLTGRFVHAQRALAIGLVSELVAQDQLLDSGLAMANDMLLASPLGLRLTKEALNATVDASSLEAAVAIEDRQQNLLMATQDHLEAVAAFKQKRKPQYKNT